MNKYYYECAEGWFPIIETAIYLCEEYCKENSLTINFEQIKEKFGTLRMYYVVTEKNHSKNYVANIDYIRGVIKTAECISAKTCEFTGRPGKLYTKKGEEFGWWKTLCSETAKEFGYTE
jgi:hypothetical protein